MWNGYRVGTVQRFQGKGGDGSGAEVWIELLPCGNRGMVCSGCGGPATRVHETAERWIQDLPILDAETRLLVHRRLVLCPRCGRKLEELPWLGRHQGTTRRMARGAASLCKVLPVKHVAEFYGLDRKTGRRIDRAYRRRRSTRPNWSR
jgi:transposase